MEFTREQLRQGVQNVSRVWKHAVRKAGLEGVLREPDYELTTRSRNWGFWDPERRTLGVQARFAVLYPTSGEFIDTVRHELAHQYVSEVVKNEHETDHGPTWQSAARMFGADPKATALDTLDDECARLSQEDNRIVRKVRKLLALGSSSEENEAHVATMRARELMQKHHIESLEKEGGKWDFRTLGVPMKRRPRWMFTVSAILRDHYNVRCIWVPHTSLLVPDEKKILVKPGRNQASILEVTGTPANVEIAEHVFDFLVAEGKRRAKGYKGTRKLDFLCGLYLGFQAKLNEQKKTIEAAPEFTGGSALLRQSDEELRRFYERRHPSIRTIRAGGRTTFNPGAFNSGEKEGKKITINPAVSKGNRGRALTFSG